MSTPVLLLLFALVAPSLAGRLPFIIGGTPVYNAANFPWQGSLQGSRGGHSCGFAIISNYWAVTAAHCVGTNPASYNLVVGTVYWRSGGKSVTPSQIIRHSGYNNAWSCPAGSGSFTCDIALMRVSSFQVDNKNIVPITMASGGEDYSGDSCDITGWGLTTVGGGGSVAEQLQHAKITVYSPTKCSGDWPGSINKGHVCIGASGRGSCNGDSGGPLSCGQTLVGVTSWGINGCYTTRPSVYTRISFFREWIRSQTGV